MRNLLSFLMAGFMADAAAIQPLLFAPAELRACGLRDAHHNPLVATRTSAGVRSWRTSPDLAWLETLVEWSRTANSYAALAFDCDSRESRERAHAVAAGYGDLPRPNVVAMREATEHLQVFYHLAVPVHRGAGARARPLAAFGRVSEFYADALRSDPGYVSVLSYNPTDAAYITEYPRADPFTLAELAEAVPASWRRPAAPDLATEPGRNCSLFARLCALALRCSDDGLLTRARSLNCEFAVPLPEAEVSGIWRSVCRYRAIWRERGHQPSFLFRQAIRGRRSGLARRPGSLAERQPWADLGISRRTWFRRFRWAKALGESAVAKVGTRTNTDRSPF